MTQNQSARDADYWRKAYEDLVDQTGRDLNDGLGVDPRRIGWPASSGRSALRLSSGGQGSSAARIPTEVGSFQSRVLPWLMECFGAEIAGDVEERCDRFIEEALEQAQSLDWPKERAHALVEYVYGRPKGEPHQEAGGVMVTFAALCQAAGLDMTQAGDDELARIMRPEIVLKIRAKQAAKPTGSALPIAASQVGTDEQSEGVHKDHPQQQGEKP